MKPWRVLIIDNGVEENDSPAKILKKEDYPILEATNGEKGLALFQDKLPEVVIHDLKLPHIGGKPVLTKIHEIDHDTPVIILVDHSESLESAIEAMQLGAFHLIMRPIKPEELLLAVRKAVESRSIKKEVQWLQKEIPDKTSQLELVGSSPKALDLLQWIDKVANSDASTVLLQGSSGTGKNLVARLIHCRSRRTHSPFVEINCASLPETLIESELFGYEKGAFTDAKHVKRGLFEVANGGAILLDEIVEMSPSIQAKLLQVIESRTFRRVGGIEDLSTDIRVIAATNVNLREAVAQKKFREDLYYRLQLITIQVPSLSERHEDIPILVQSFIDSFNKNYHKNIRGITEEALDLLKHHTWPGNIRELRNVIERVVLLESAEWITPLHLPPEIRLHDSKADSLFTIPSHGINLDEVEKELIHQALEKTFGNQSRAADLLGITRHTLRYRMEKFGLLH